jgi:copper resistance protein C
MSIRRALARAALPLALAWAAAPVAAAHAVLDHATPRVGSTVRVAPQQLSLFFSQGLAPASSTVAVVDERGARVDEGDARVDPRDASIVRVSLRPLPAGTYTVRWRVASLDSHPTEGEFTFRVAP